MELRLAQQEPCLVEKWVVLFLSHPYFFFLRLLPVSAFGLWSCRDAVQAYCLLTFLYSLVEVSFSERDGVLIARHEERNELGAVVLVPGSLGLDSVEISHMAVIIRVVACLESLYTTSKRRVLLG